MRVSLDLSLAPPRIAPGSALPELAPVPGILDAANVVILGASIMESAFGRSAEGAALRPALLECFVAAGFTGTLHSWASAGDQVSHTRAEFAAAKAALSADEGANLYIAHTGGNNVSGQRPWPGGQASFVADYDALIAEVTATDTLLPLPLTKRLYGKEGGYADPLSVIPGDAGSEANGSKPYNEGIVIPRIAQIMPDWLDASGVPFVNPYELADTWPDLTGSDGVHGYGMTMARYILAKTAGRALGVAKGASRAGRALVYDIRGNADPADMAWGADFNRYQTYPGGGYVDWLHGARFTDGGFDPHVTVWWSGQYQTGSSYTPEAFARIADPRFHRDEIVAGGLYVQGAQVFTLHIGGLSPGDRMTMTCVGVRGAAGTNRRGGLTLMAGGVTETRVLDAATDAASNQVTFGQVEIPDSGEVALSLAVMADGQYGYLHGLVMDFA